MKAFNFIHIHVVMIARRAYVTAGTQTQTTSYAVIGQTVGHYRITAQLGSGGMGEVYLADDTTLDRKVALKFLPPSLWNKPEAQQRLIREAKAASQLDHPNIVTIFGIDEYEGRPFIVMANVPGVTLDAYCAAEERTTDTLLGLAVQIADGLQHAHDAGVIHRDLKPSNIKVDAHGRARVLDFGIASLRGATKLTQTGATIGTLAYAPPELAMGKEAQATGDIYSLGVVMYEMLTGQLPFEADHEAALLYAIINEAPRAFSEFSAMIPSDVQAIVMRCLEKHPERRFASCAELACELRQALTDTSGSAVRAPESKPSIAVLPFTNMSADPENEYFSDGLTEELLTVLAKNPGLKVTGRMSCFAFKGKNEDLREIGHRLGVETLLEGSVRKAGNRVRITTQLVKAADGFHLWSETYDRVLDDIFAVQDDIAQSVSEALCVKLLGQTEPTARGNTECYDLVLLANHYVARNTKEALAKAVDLYQEAIALDSHYARAWAGLAGAYGTQAGFGYEDGAVVCPKAKQAAERALELDSTLPDAHDVMGWLHLAFEFEWEKAGQSFRRAHALAPGDGHILFGFASYEFACGRLDEANRMVAESVALDPLNAMAHTFRARIQMASDRYEAAIGSYAKALELSPGITGAHSAVGTIRMLQGRLDDALAEALQETSAGYRRHTLAMIYHMLGDSKQSDVQLAALVNEGEQWGMQVAIVHARRGESDEAFNWLERSYALHDPGIMSVKVQPLLRGLHGDARWGIFLHKIGLGT